MDYLPVLLLRMEGLCSAGERAPAEKDERSLQSGLGPLPHAGLGTAGAGEGADKGPGMPLPMAGRDLLAALAAAGKPEAFAGLLWGTMCVHSCSGGKEVINVFFPLWIFTLFFEAGTHLVQTGFKLTM